MGNDIIGSENVEIRYSKRAVKTISGLDKPTKQRIKKSG